jgi:DNA-binding IclR family transcriptional regulator
MMPLHEGLKGSQLAVHIAIKTLSACGCKPSISELVDCTLYSERTVRHACRVLVALGYVTEERDTRKRYRCLN